MKESRQTRLGRRFYETQRLQPEAIMRTAEAVAEFAGLRRKTKPPHSRHRHQRRADAGESRSISHSAVELASGLKIENCLRRAGRRSWCSGGDDGTGIGAGRHLLLLDVGGGSTEFILGQGERQIISPAQFFRSATVRLHGKISAQRSRHAQRITLPRLELKVF